MMQYVIGVDIGGTQIRAALISAEGAILAHEIAYERVIVDLYHDVPILPASLGEPAGVLGAAALMLAAAEGR